MDILPGLISKACILLIFHLSQASFLCLLFCCPRPLCIHGNSYLLGSTTGNQQGLTRLGSDQHHCEKHASISVICLPMRVGIKSLVASLVYWSEVPQMGLTFQLTLIGCSDHVQQCCVQLLNFQSGDLYTLTVFDHYLYGIHNHVDTSQLMTILCCQLLFVSF